MAVAIRLRRAGKKQKVLYHVVATDSRCARNGKYLERLGYYDPRQAKPVFKIDQERYDHWVKMGASISRTVAQLVERNKPPAASPKG
jgi:small subunit ribosomal protein S16